jgi:uncharacterized protein (DUF305 family)
MKFGKLFRICCAASLALVVSACNSPSTPDASASGQGNTTSPHAGMSHHHGGDHKSTSDTPNTPSTIAYIDAHAKMSTAMAITYSGDADQDFVRGMIPHHQGAIDMAKVVLEHGKDPQIRKLAEDIVAAQEKEIADMNAWLTKNAPAAAAAAK